MNRRIRLLVGCLLFDLIDRARDARLVGARSLPPFRVPSPGCPCATCLVVRLPGAGTLGDAALRALLRELHQATCEAARVINAKSATYLRLYDGARRGWAEAARLRDLLDLERAESDQLRRTMADRYDCHGGPGTTTRACGGCISCLTRQLDAVEGIEESVADAEAVAEIRSAYDGRELAYPMRGGKATDEVRHMHGDIGVLLAMVGNSTRPHRSEDLRTTIRLIGALLRPREHRVEIMARHPEELAQAVPPRSQVLRYLYWLPGTACYRYQASVRVGAVTVLWRREARRGEVEILERNGTAAEPDLHLVPLVLEAWLRMELAYTERGS